MNEKGIIAYCNIFILYFVSLTLMVNLLATLASNKNISYYYESSQSIDYLEECVNEFFITLSSYDEIPNKISTYGNTLVYINLIDNVNMIYQVKLRNKSEMLALSNYGTVSIEFIEKDDNFKLIKVEMCYG